MAWLLVKMCPPGGVWEDQQLPLFIVGHWDHLHISETNGAKKLKVGTVVGICRYYDSV